MRLNGGRPVPNFLSALGEDMKIEALKKNAFDLLSPFHSAFLDLLKRYFYVGGMPEAVASFVADKDYGKVRAIQKKHFDGVCK